MAEQTNETKVVAVNPAKEIDKGSYVVETVDFSGTGDMRGFSYDTLRFKLETDEEVEASRKEINQRYGSKVIVSVINTFLRSALAIKARNSLPKINKTAISEKKVTEADEVARVSKEIEELRQNSPLLVDEEAAEKYIPGVREVTIQGLLAKASKLMAEAASLKSEGKHKEADEKNIEATRAMIAANVKAGLMPAPGTTTEEEEEEQS